MRVVISFSIHTAELDLLEKLRQVARRERLPQSEIIRRALKEYFERHGEGNPAIPLDSFAGEVEFPETYELLQLLRRKYGSRRVLYWDEAVDEYRRLLADRIKLDLLEKVLRILEKEGWEVSYAPE